jgi:hypothetical protein
MSKKSICLSMILLLCAASQGLTCDVSPVAGTPKPVVGNNKARPIRLLKRPPDAVLEIFEQRLVRVHQVMEVKTPKMLKRLQELQLQPDDWVFYIKQSWTRSRGNTVYAIYNAYTGKFISKSEMISFSDTDEVIPPIELDDTQSKQWREVKSTLPEECREEFKIVHGRFSPTYLKTIRLPPPIDPIDKAHTGHFISNNCE